MHQDHLDRTDPAFEYSEITDQVLIGTNSCCQTHFEESILSQGVTVDISLEGEHLDMPQGVEAYLWLPTPDRHAPERAKTEIGIAALKRALGDGKKVYIHCRNGHGRAPTFFAAYLIREEGMKAEDAVAFIKGRRPSIHLEETQTDFLKDLEK